MNNEGIKKAIDYFLSKNNETNKEFYENLLVESNQLESLREDVDAGLLRLKKSIIASNLHLIIDKIFKGNNDDVIEILQNTKNRSLFYDFTEEFNKFLILYEQYNNKLEFSSPDLGELKELFVLKDEKLFEIIKEINLDKQ